ncbi:MAG TPA: carboxylate-amine ligase, partial [Kiloniellales bacterium]|nr:carboxylate-amine ligase [Kiloniellales bacterium]
QGLIDFGIGRIVPYADLLEEILELVRVDALALDCVAEAEHARKIVTGGTSAHRQLAVYHDAIARGAERDEALKAVVDMLIAETAADL